MEPRLDKQVLKNAKSRTILILAQLNERTDRRQAWYLQETGPSAVAGGPDRRLSRRQTQGNSLREKEASSLGP